MRNFGAPSKVRSVFGRPYDPNRRIPAPDPVSRRRLTDDVQAILSRACDSNEPEAAADLLALLEKWQTRNPERRNVLHHLDSARREVERLNRRIGQKVPPPG